MKNRVKIVLIVLAAFMLIMIVRGLILGNHFWETGGYEKKMNVVRRDFANLWANAPPEEEAPVSDYDLKVVLDQRDDVERKAKIDLTKMYHVYLFAHHSWEKKGVTYSTPGPTIIIFW